LILVVALIIDHISAVQQKKALTASAMSFSKAAETKK